jgi:hypothetical protein
VSRDLTGDQAAVAAKLKQALESGDWATRAQRAQEDARRFDASEQARIRALSTADLNRLARLVRGELKNRSAVKRSKRRTITEADPRLLPRVAAAHDFARRALKYGAEDAERLVAMVEGVPQKTAERYIRQARALNRLPKK